MFRTPQDVAAGGHAMNGLTANTLMMITTFLGVPALFLGTAYLFRKLDSKERLLAIEKGLYHPTAPLEVYRRTRRAAIVLVAGGLGIILAFVIAAVVAHNFRMFSPGGLGIVPLAIGLGLLFDLRLERRDEHAAQSRAASPASDREPQLR
jgi:hypothetical protein